MKHLGIYLEPVDSAAVDNRRKLPDSISEAISNRAHGQNQMELITDYLDEEVEKGDRTSVSLKRLFSLPVDLPHFLAELDTLVNGEYVWNLARVQQVTQVFQKLLFFYLEHLEISRSWCVPNLT